jgi:CHAP domain
MAAALLAATVPAFVFAISQPTGPADAAAITAMPLQQFVNDGANGRLWNAYDETAGASGPTIEGTPSALLYGGTPQVFVRSATGDLVQYANDDAGGQAWNAYDLTTAADGLSIVDDPTAIVVGTSVYVFGSAANGDLVEYTNDGVGGQIWNTFDLSQQVGVTIQNDASALLVGSTLEVFAEASTNDLVEFSGTGSGARSWTEVDLTTASAGPTLSDSPNAVLYGASTHVYGVSSAGHLFEFDNDDVGGRLWNAYDLTVDGGGPAVSGRPSPIIYGATVHVETNSNGHLVEFDNDDAGGRLWNSYDITQITNGPVITGSPTAVRFVGPIVDIYAQGPGGDLENYINDDAGGRLWNPYDLTVAADGPTTGGDPAALVDGSSVAVFVAGPPPPAVIQSIISAAESQDQYNLAVTENPPGSNCNIYTAYWGRGSTVGCAPGTSAEEWCSDFAQWVWAAAGIDTTGIDGWAFTFVDWGQDHLGAWQPGATNDPEPGDAVVWGDVASGYAVHVGIVVGVSQGMIDVVSGNSGPPIDAAGDVDAVWDSDYFDAATSTIGGYPIIGYVSPTGWTGFAADAQLTPLPQGSLSQLIATQDDGK